MPDLILSVAKTCKKCGEQFTGVRCKPCHRLYAIAQYYRNKDHVLAGKRLYHQKNKEKILAIKAAKYAKSPEPKKAASVQYRKDHPEKRRIYWQNRESKKRKSGDALSSGIAKKLFKLQHGKCACCGQKLGDVYHLDHKMPLKLGGRNIDDNMQLLTPKCNMQKSAKHPIDYMQSRGFLL